MHDRLLPAVMSVAEFSAWARLGKTRIYEEIASGALKTFTVGRRRLIATADAHDWLARYQCARPALRLVGRA
ncbi:hypothetical protein [Sphingomonas jatrophae]|uniref:DNA binding domain-containing protein, excisionase family n=1 Tax=Sphingomonas jatrophae TaxID=1166337 RepID=A0A1I6L2G1_9SPHN|nr:hypothetical protein [Sphingomonas jatrophae]SFR97654.1 hypothetical protein SAMN05192580_2190 [Sphingomonas jatrophae]